MKCPKWLKDEAAEHWKRYAPMLIQEGTLTPLTLEGFCWACDVYRILRSMDMVKEPKQGTAYNGLLKRYQEFSKQYGMLPKDRKQSGLGQKEESIQDALRKSVGDA